MRWPSTCWSRRPSPAKSLCRFWSGLNPRYRAEAARAPSMGRAGSCSQKKGKTAQCRRTRTRSTPEMARIPSATASPTRALTSTMV